MLGWQGGLALPDHMTASCFVPRTTNEPDAQRPAERSNGSRGILHKHEARQRPAASFCARSLLVTIHSGPPPCRPPSPVSRALTRAVAGRYRTAGRAAEATGTARRERPSARWHVGYFSSSPRARAYNRQERTAPSPICQKVRHLDGQRAHAHAKNGPPDHPIDRIRKRGACRAGQERSWRGAGPSPTTRWRGGRSG